MSLYKWSQVANNDATADPSINFAEGQAPSSLNDSCRAMMAATAKYRDDIAGAIATTGTSSAYLVSSYQAFDTLAHLNGQMIAFTPHVTNAGACTLNLDSLTAKPLRTAPNAELSAGTIIQGTPYLALYNNADGAFYLHGFYGSPYSIPIAGSIEYWAATAPNSSFAFPFGQAINRTTYATLFGLIGTTYGTGDGSTTFNLPDLRGRFTASADAMGGTDASRLVGTTQPLTSRTLGGVGGEAVHTSIASEVPQLTVSVSGGISVTSSINNILSSNANVVTVPGGTSGNAVGFPNGTVTALNTVTSTGTASLSGLANSGVTAAAHNNLPPTIVCNRIFRII